MTKLETDITIIGSGIVGSTLALALARKNAVKHNYKITLLDTRDLQSGISTQNQEKPDPRISAINQVSQTLFHQIDLWPQLMQHACSYQSMLVQDGHNDATLNFSAEDMGLANLGYTISNQCLLGTLHNELDKIINAHKSINFLRISAINSIKSQQCGDASDINLILYDQSKLQLSSKLIIAADGKASVTRDMMAIKYTAYPVEQVAVVSLVDCEKGHNCCARQIFLVEGPMALLPTRQTNQCALIWSCSPAQAELLKQCNQQDFNAQVTSYSRYVSGNITCSSERYYYPVTQILADSCVAERFVLMGDAAHSIHPLAGLGLNLGLADVSTMIDCIEQYGLEVRGLLAAYQKLRQAENEKVFLVCKLINHVFRQNNWYTSLMRKTGVNLINRLEWIKQELITMAMDPSAKTLVSELPRQLTSFVLKGLNEMYS